ncbi:hypothetical protein DY000_02054014 [Brassica cretica]|uniref:Uncharacterized protein n=1 Tax=Brassica cretica TaxID=69181 RepID=A0ABQ7AAD1_BRACR|nr:hypothetical protein DY000_02054014 [Brassica cretica]
MSLSASPVPQTGVSGVRHSTFEYLRLGHSSQSIASGLLINLPFQGSDLLINLPFQGSDLTNETTRVVIRLLIDQ